MRAHPTTPRTVSFGNGESVRSSDNTTENVVLQYLDDHWKVGRSPMEPWGGMVACGANLPLLGLKSDSIARPLHCSSRGSPGRITSQSVESVRNWRKGRSSGQRWTGRESFVRFGRVAPPTESRT